MIAQLRCPICHDRLTGPTATERTLRCPSRHSFDLAKQGYADLTGGRVTHEGDTADMVAARQTLLTAGHFHAISTALIGALDAYEGKSLAVEIGAGTGHYLAELLDAQPERAGLAVDVSKPALRRAARAHPRMAAVRADIWRGLPLGDGAAGILLDIFAPRAGEEFARVLAPDGVLAVVTAEPGHLAELVEAFSMVTVDPAKRERLAAKLEPWFRLVHDETVTDRLLLNIDDAASLVRMGPSGHHLEPAAVTERLTRMPVPIRTNLSTRLTLWRLRD